MSWILPAIRGRDITVAFLSVFIYTTKLEKLGEVDTLLRIIYFWKLHKLQIIASIVTGQVTRIRCQNTLGKGHGLGLGWGFGVHG